MPDDRALVLAIPEPRSLELIFSTEDLQKLQRDYQLMECSLAELPALLPKARYIIGQPPLPGDLLANAPHLKAIFNVESNFLDNMDYDQCFARGIHVLTTGKVFALPVAEIGLGLALALERNIVGADRDFRHAEELWGGDGNGAARLLSGGAVGFIGFGDLGRALHKLLRGFEPQIKVYDPWLPAGFLADYGVAAATLDDVLTQSDVIFVVASATTENGGFLGAEAFAKMRAGASFILLSRASVVDFDALMAAVATGHIRAASDVFPQEPLPRDHPVRQLNGFILSAHRAGALDRAFRQMGRMVLDDLALLERGLPPVQCRRAERETVRLMRSKPVERN